jgi:hypothetical protein
MPRHTTKTSYLLLVLLAVAGSCQTTFKSPQATLSKQPVRSRQGVTIADSLAKYQAADSLLLVNDSTHTVLHIGKAGTAKYAIWLVDSTLIFYQQQSGRQWLACDTLSYTLDFSFAQSTDLNADGVADVRISTISGSAGNTENVVFLFDSKQGRFRHNRYYDLPNVELDKQHKFIKSWWYAGVVHCQEKWRYRITGDSLTFEAGVSYCPNQKDLGNTGKLEFYKLVKKRKVTTKKYAGDAEKLMDTFIQALWDASNDF